MKIRRYSDKLTFFLCLINVALFYLSIIWRVTGSLDRVITDSIFYSSIFYLLWQNQNQINFKKNVAASFIATILMTIVIVKGINLFTFENQFIFIIPFFTAFSLSCFASGFSGVLQYEKELFLSIVLFFPQEIIGLFLEKFMAITIVNTKVATYLLYYLGFNVTSQNNNVLLHIPDVGHFKAVVNYSCSGIPMIVLLFKLSIILICLFPFNPKKTILIPMISIITGFFMGVIRVCILTISIPNSTIFDYWHGDNGAQIFSTLAIMLFSGFAYWLTQKQGFLIRE